LRDGTKSSKGFPLEKLPAKKTAAADDVLRQNVIAGNAGPV
jgi:hypothetical protein